MCTIPINYITTISLENPEYWFPSMQKEFDSLVENHTFELENARMIKTFKGANGCIL